jgi:phosphotransferase system HPr (HPr) family protein
MVEKKTEVRNEAGIHVRPSGVILEEAKDYPGSIEVEANGTSMKLNNVMGLLSLGLVQGSEVTIRVEGPDEEKEAEKLAELFSRHFDFPPRKGG